MGYVRGQVGQRHAGLVAHVFVVVIAQAHRHGRNQWLGGDGAMLFEVTAQCGRAYPQHNVVKAGADRFGHGFTLGKINTRSDKHALRTDANVELRFRCQRKRRFNFNFAAGLTVLQLQIIFC